MFSPTRKVGNSGEEIARQYLERKSYNILESNYLKPYGEVDIIAWDKAVLVFIEVKTRISGQKKVYLPPESNVNYYKGRKIIRTALAYMEEKGIPEDVLWRIDVISVELDCENRKAKVRHLENAIVG